MARQGVVYGLLGMVGLLAWAGCRQNAPFRLAPVRGRVVYEDGSPVRADQIKAAAIRIAFVPQDAAPVGQAHPTAAQATLKPDGTFSDLTTYQFGDGAIVGRHKVTLIAVDAMEQPLPTIPKQYWNVSTTPLEVTVAKGDNDFELKIKKGP